MNYQVVIPAAGQGKRMRAKKNKLLMELRGLPVIVHTLKVFESDPWCEGIILATQPEEKEIFLSLVKQHGITKVQSIVAGGRERQHSVRSGLNMLKNCEAVLVHDGARPFITINVIHRLVDRLTEFPAAIAAVPVKDTIKKGADGLVSETIDRSSLWSVQTPQAFRVPILLEAHEAAERDSFLGTDDSSLVERLGIPVQIVEGDYDNIKLTTPEDLFFAEAILNKRLNEQ
ncbi:2-C-methyl-D-erythritol 4-phosphate cytidylyltransferase [Bacillus smithii]|uniref:2-C-methyl-D-erythritol 4-phosphate cytidylyltransferase n=1 Tax=Bacillus smithii TaxID=1479 RepID=UPI0030C8E007